MEEAKVPLEHLHVEIHDHSEHSSERWISWVALSAIGGIFLALGFVQH